MMNLFLMNEQIRMGTWDNKVMNDLMVEWTSKITNINMLEWISELKLSHTINY